MENDQGIGGKLVERALIGAGRQCAVKGAFAEVLEQQRDGDGQTLDGEEVRQLTPCHGDEAERHDADPSSPQEMPATLHREYAGDEQRDGADAHTPRHGRGRRPARLEQPLGERAGRAEGSSREDGEDEAGEELGVHGRSA